MAVNTNIPRNNLKISLLSSINLEVGHGQLVAVVGHVGSGKSSLVSAMLGEMNKKEGRVTVNVRILKEHFNRIKFQFKLSHTYWAANYQINVNNLFFFQGSISFVPQQAWIQNATLRNNILFGKNYRHSKYDRIIEACALKPDLQILPGGDKIEIGEKVSSFKKVSVHIFPITQCMAIPVDSAYI